MKKKEENIALQIAESQWRPAYLRAVTGERAGRREEAIEFAQAWIACCHNPPMRHIGIVRPALFRDMERRIRESLQTSNADFFRWFADALETKGRSWSKVREWLVWKHLPRSRSLIELIKRRGEKGPIPESVPRFTHAQLLADADQEGIVISDRQLRRLMRELGFRFKHSRTQ